eukprot:2135889-Prymnesium_polylepis.2
MPSKCTQSRLRQRSRRRRSLSPVVSAVSGRKSVPTPDVVTPPILWNRCPVRRTRSRLFETHVLASRGPAPSGPRRSGPRGGAAADTARARDSVYSNMIT